MYSMYSSCVKCYKHNNRNKGNSQCSSGILPRLRAYSQSRKCRAGSEVGFLQWMSASVPVKKQHKISHMSLEDTWTIIRVSSRQSTELIFKFKTVPLAWCFFSPFKSLIIFFYTPTYYLRAENYLLPHSLGLPWGHPGTSCTQIHSAGDRAW